MRGQGNRSDEVKVGQGSHWGGEWRHRSRSVEAQAPLYNSSGKAQGRTLPMAPHLL
jgi:hypothetical protein